MILDANNKKHLKYRIFDANGVELKYLTMADTETGAIMRLVRDDNGKFKADEYGNLVIETTTVPAPLLLTE